MLTRHCESVTRGHYCCLIVLPGWLTMLDANVHRARVSYVIVPTYCVSIAMIHPHSVSDPSGM